MSAPVAIDLFAGAGGLSLGAEAAGVSVPVAIERDAWACATLRANQQHERVIEQDLSLMSDAAMATELPRYPELVMGGPPCQGFSHAGPRSKDPKDPRNALFRDFLRVVRATEPATALIENVPGLLRAKTASGERVADIIVAEFLALGYEVEIVRAEACHHGVPQLRPRVFFLASQRGTPPKAILPTHGDANLMSCVERPVTLWEAISDLPPVDVGFTGPTIEYVGPPTNDFQRAMRVGAPHELQNHVPMRHSPRSVARFRLIGPGQSQTDVPEEFQPRRRVRAVDAPAGYDQNNRRMRPDRPCHTVPASFYTNFLHPYLHRNFTPREGARIQGFPDWYVFCGKRTTVSRKLLAREGRNAERYLNQYEQIGNAVPPPLARAVVAALREGTDAAALPEAA